MASQYQSSSLLNRLTKRGARSGSRGGGDRGFTLLELIVVVGVLATLVAVLLPVLNRATGKAQAMKLQSDLQAIGLALDAYKADFGDYPRVYQPGTGSQVLAKALLSPGDEVDKPYAAGLMREGSLVTQAGKRYMAQKDTTVAPPGASTDWLEVPIAYGDSADGPGFRVRLQFQDPGMPRQGKVWGPYLEPNKFKVGLQMQIVDSFGSPILYFPARPGITNIRGMTTAQPSQRIQPNFPKQRVSKMIEPKPLYVGTSSAALYNFEDNHATTPTNPPDTLMFSAFTDHVVTSPKDAEYLGTGASPDPVKMRLQLQYRLETAGEFKGPYLLWSAGPDGMFFTQDDVMNAKP